MTDVFSRRTKTALSTPRTASDVESSADLKDSATSQVFASQRDNTVFDQAVFDNAVFDAGSRAKAREATTLVSRRTRTEVS